MNWLNLLESHFNHRKKAFLIFDNNHILRYSTDYAKEILEIDDHLTGIITLNELFPPSDKNPQFLVDKDYSFETIHNIFYTTPSGRSKELRVNRDSQLQKIRDISGYIIWIEAQSRDITSVYKRVSSLDPYRDIGWLFDQSNHGFILINKEGIIEKSNDKIKKYIGEPGDWKGRNIYTFSFMHQHDIINLIAKCLKDANNKFSQNVMLKTAGVEISQEIKWLILPITDLEGSIVGAIIVAGPAGV